MYVPVLDYLYRKVKFFLVKVMLEFINNRMEINCRTGPVLSLERETEKKFMSGAKICNILSDSVFCLFCSFRTEGQRCVAPSLKQRDWNKSNKSLHVISWNMNSVVITRGSCKDSYR